MTSAARMMEMPVHPSLGHLLRRASRLMMLTVETRFGGADINFSQWTALRLVRDGDGLVIAELARGMGMTIGAVTRIVEGLETRQLLVRRPGVAGRRSTVLELTGAGETILAETSPLLATRWNRLLADLSGEDVARLMSLLGTLTESLQRNGRTTDSFAET